MNAHIKKMHSRLRCHRALLLLVSCSLALLSTASCALSNSTSNGVRDMPLDDILEYFQLTHLSKNFANAGAYTLGDVETMMRNGHMGLFKFNNNFDRVRARHAIHKATHSDIKISNNGTAVGPVPWQDTYYNRAKGANRITSPKHLARIIGVDDIHTIMENSAIRGVRGIHEHPYDLVVGAMSSRDEFATRQLLRTTWAHDATSERVLIRFWIGIDACDIPPDKRQKFDCVKQKNVEVVTDVDRRRQHTENLKVTARLLDEAEYYGDIAFLDMRDYYRTLPEKLIRGVEWFVNRVNFKWAMKIDVDCFLNVNKMLAHLGSPNWRDAWQDKVWGAALRGPGPVHRDGKWAEKHYELKQYPKFHHQISVLSAGLCKVLVRNAEDWFRYQGEDTSLAIWMLGFRVQKRDVKAMNKCNQLSCFTGHDNPNQKIIEHYQKFVGPLQSAVVPMPPEKRKPLPQALPALHVDDQSHHILLDDTPDAVSFCDRSAHLRGWSQRAFLLEEPRILACLPAKTACTVTKRAMMRVNGRQDWRKADPHNPSTNGLRRLCSTSNDKTQAVASQVLNDPSYLRFTVVRHPIERFVSAYFNKAVDSDYIRRYPPYKKWSKTRKITIESVLNWLERHQENGQLQDVDEHFAPQSACCAVDTLPVHTFEVIRHDHMVEEMTRMFDTFLMRTANSTHVNSGTTRRARRQILSTIESTHDNVSMHKSDSRSPQQVLSHDQVQRLEVIYRSDFLRFGFHVPSEWPAPLHASL